MNVVSAVKILAISVGAAIVLTPVAAELGLCCKGPQPGISERCADESVTPPGNRPRSAYLASVDIVTALETAGTFSKFLAIIESADALDLLREDGVIVLAPTNDAFKAIPETERVNLLVEDHIATALHEVGPETLHVNTLNGEQLTLLASEQSRDANGYSVLYQGNASNGVILVIDQVVSLQQ